MRSLGLSFGMSLVTRQKSVLAAFPLHIRYYSALSQPAKQPKKKPNLITDQFSTLRKKYEAPKYPIVLCHGFSGFDQLNFVPTFPSKGTLYGNFKLDYWYGIKEALEKIGSTVLIAKVPPFGTISERASDLNAYIENKCEALQKSETKNAIYNKNHSNAGDEKTFEDKNEKIKINLIAHSMGGLDSRYLISKLDHPSYQIVSLTTVSTPHHGSECADFLVDLMGETPVLKKVCPESVAELTTGALEKFNKEILDDPNVTYFSYGARFSPRWYSVFKLTWEIIKYRLLHNSKHKHKHLPLLDNDGMVTVESSRWGEYLGTLDEVDHLDLINWTNRTRTVVDRLVFQKEPKFNAIALYLDIAQNLRKKGF